jgi:Coenzyme PQQ synthesis protein D (PqqD)
MTEIRIDSKYVPSEDVVARQFEDEILIVPLTAGIGDLENELFTLNDTGRAIWLLLDGRRSLAEIAVSLAEEYEAPTGEIEQDVLGLMEELLKRRMVVEVSAG